MQANVIHWLESLRTAATRWTAATTGTAFSGPEETAKTVSVIGQTTADTLFPPGTVTLIVAPKGSLPDPSAGGSAANWLQQLSQVLGGRIASAQSTVLSTDPAAQLGAVDVRYCGARVAHLVVNGIVGFSIEQFPFRGAQLPRGAFSFVQEGQRAVPNLELLVVQRPAVLSHVETLAAQLRPNAPVMDLASAAGAFIGAIVGATRAIAGATRSAIVATGRVTAQVATGVAGNYAYATLTAPGAAQATITAPAAAAETATAEVAAVAAPAAAEATAEVTVITVTVILAASPERMDSVLLNNAPYNWKQELGDAPTLEKMLEVRERLLSLN